MKTIETRGDLPPLAATLNKELKSDSPGGAARPAFLLSATATRARSPMYLDSFPGTIRHAASGAPAGAIRGKRIVGPSTGCMCMGMCMGRIQGCRPGTAARPGGEQRG